MSPFPQQIDALVQAWVAIGQPSGANRFLDLWAEDGIWDYPSAPGERSYENTVAGRSAVAGRLTYAASGRIVEINNVSVADDTVMIVSTLHSPTRSVMMSLAATFRDGRIACLKETYDPALLPIRWVFRWPDQPESWASEAEWPGSSRLVVPTTGTHGSTFVDLAPNDLRVISS